MCIALKNKGPNINDKFKKMLSSAHLTTFVDGKEGGDVEYDLRACPNIDLNGILYLDMCTHLGLRPSVSKT